MDYIGNTYTLKQVSNTDYDFLKQTHHATLKSHINKMWGWDEEFQDNYFKEGFNKDNLKLIIINNNLVGYLEIHKNENTINIVNILIQPEHQGYGLGTQIIEDILKEAATQSLSVALGVFKVNTDAKKLYERLGFKITEETKTHFLMKIDALGLTNGV